MSFPILLLRLEGPLQSWGERAKWNYRDTASFPTKSGVVGLLASAMGISRDSSEVRDIYDALSIVIRADRSGELLTDYHTIQANEIKTANNSKRSGNTLVSNRDYLQDASFLVAAHGPAELLQRIEAALRHPKWTLFLGRKCCVPSVPLVGVRTEEYASLEDAVKKVPLAKRHDDRILIEKESSDGTGQPRTDVWLGNRDFGVRYVLVEPYNGEGDDRVSE